MAPTVAEQVQKAQVAREETRCRQIELAKGKKVKRTTIPMPVVRGGPKALCQNLEYLADVAEYDYDLSDLPFQDYCLSRGMLHLAGAAGSTRWRYHADYWLSKDDYLAAPYFRFAQEHEGNRYKYSPSEMDVQWRIIHLARATLQDCWELYQGKTIGEPSIPKPDKSATKGRANAKKSRLRQESAARKNAKPETGKLDFSEPGARGHEEKPRTNKRKTR